MDKLISIIVPVYKTEKYLDRCIESIVNQTYKNLEIILVDDDSPDNCPAICDEWAQKDKRIKVLHIENKGVANARNQGLKIATGNYIGFVDSDDFTEPDMFEILFGNALKNDSDISVCGYQINEEPNDEANIRKVSQFDALKLIVMGDYKYGVLWNKLYKNEIIKDIKMPHFACCEDLVFNYYAFKKANKIVECDDKLYHYMQNEDSVSHKEFNVGSFDAVYSKEIILKEELGTKLEKYAIRGLISSCIVAINSIIHSGKFEDKYDYVRDYILKYRTNIYSSNLYTIQEKLKTVLLVLSPKLYSKFYMRSHS